MVETELLKHAFGVLSVVFIIFYKKDSFGLMRFSGITGRDRSEKARTCCGVYTHDTTSKARDLRLWCRRGRLTEFGFKDGQ